MGGIFIELSTGFAHQFMNIITGIGLLAGMLTTIAFLPQAIKTWKTKSTRDVSLGMFVIFCTGVFLWIVYGTLIKDLPIILTNVATLVLASTILWFKLKYH
ncbi:hypothetical protein B9T07_06130 [Limnospira fusiformis CCALA 023]|nr:hypothetical protein NIES39_A08050 [Arthrospira platensis NIES-39]